MAVTELLSGPGTLQSGVMSVPHRDSADLGKESLALQLANNRPPIRCSGSTSEAPTPVSKLWDRD